MPTIAESERKAEHNGFNTIRTNSTVYIFDAFTNAWRNVALVDEFLDFYRIFVLSQTEYVHADHNWIACDTRDTLGNAMDRAIDILRDIQD